MLSGRPEVREYIIDVQGFGDSPEFLSVLVNLTQRGQQYSILVVADELACGRFFLVIDNDLPRSAQLPARACSPNHSLKYLRRATGKRLPRT